MSFDQNTLDSLKIDRDAPSRASGGARGWIVTLVIVAVAGAGGAYWHAAREAYRGQNSRQPSLRRPRGGGAQAGAAVLNASGYVVARREATRYPRKSPARSSPC